MGGRGISKGYKLGSNAGNIYWGDNSGWNYNVKRYNYEKLFIESYVGGVLKSKYCKDLLMGDRSVISGNSVEVRCIFIDPDMYLQGLKLKRVGKVKSSKDSTKRRGMKRRKKRKSDFRFPYPKYPLPKYWDMDAGGRFAYKYGYFEKKILGGIDGKKFIR